MFKSHLYDSHLLKFISIIVIAVILVSIIAFVMVDYSYSLYLDEKHLTFATIQQSNTFNNFKESLENTHTILVQIANYPNIADTILNSTIFDNNLINFIGQSLATLSCAENFYIYSPDKNKLFNFTKKIITTAEIDLTDDHSFSDQYGIYTYPDNSPNGYAQAMTYCPDPISGTLFIIPINPYKVSSTLFDYSIPSQHHFLYYNNQDSFVPLYKSLLAFPNSDEITKILSTVYQQTSLRKSIEIDGKVYTAITQYDEDTNYAIISLFQPETFKASETVQQGYYLLLAIFLLAIFIIIISIKTTKKAYLPISELKEELSEIKLQNERTYEQKMLKTVLDCNQIFDADVEEAYSTVSDIFSADEPIFMITARFLQPEKFKQNYNHIQREVILNNLPNFFVNSIFSTKSIWTYTANEQLVFVFQHNNIALSTIKKQIEDISLYVLAEYDLKFSVIINENVSVQDISSFYTAATNKLNNTFFKHTLFADNIIDQHNGELFIQNPKADEYLNTIALRLSSNQFDGLHEILDSYFELLSRYSPESILALLNECIILIFRSIDKTKYSIESTMHTTIKKIYSASTFSECKDILSGIFTELTDAYNQQQMNKSKNAKLITGIYEYIDENFAHPDFSTDTVSSHFNYATAYIMRLFKAETNHSMADYILEKRINYAAQLLKESNLSVKEVYTKCGFTNSSYFSAIFKKIYGTSPSNYRKL